MLKIAEVPKVVMFKTGEPTVHYEGNCSDATKLAAWTSLNGNILVRELDAQKLSEISSSEIPVFLLLHTNTTNVNERKKILQQLAPEFTDVLSFYFADIQNFPGLARQVGLHPDAERSVVLYPPKGHHYVVPENV